MRRLTAPGHLIVRGVLPEASLRRTPPCRRRVRQGYPALPNFVELPPRRQTADAFFPYPANADLQIVQPSQRRRSLSSGSGSHRNTRQRRGLFSKAAEEERRRFDAGEG